MNAATSVKGFLEAMHRLQTSIERREKGTAGEWVYATQYEFLLKHGRAFESQPLPDAGLAALVRATGRRKLRLKECFKNAAEAVLFDDTGTLSYCEGYASGIIPVHHAWVLFDGTVVCDVTWNRQRGLSTSLGGKILGTFDPETQAYFGVRFSRLRLRDAVIETKMYGSLLEDYMRGFPLLYQPFEPEKEGR